MIWLAITGIVWIAGGIIIQLTNKYHHECDYPGCLLPVFWPFVIPDAILEFFSRHQPEQSQPKPKSKKHNKRKARWRG